MADLEPIIPGVDNGAADTGVDEPSAADLAEDAEWDAALDEFAPGLSKANKEVADEQADTTTTTTTIAPEEPETTTTTTAVDPSETAEQKVQRELVESEAAAKAKAGDDEAEVEPGEDPSIRATRQTVREAAKQVEALATDIRAKMFADQPTELKDADGDPIKTIADVMKLTNPNTIGSEEYPQGRGFTEEEAGQWLLAAQQQLNQNLAATDKQINQIANVNADMKDQAESINYQYGELLKSMPELRDQIWQQYEKTLVKDPDSDIITAMPVSLEDFYDMALQPYVKLAESLEAQEQAKVEAEKQAAEQAKKAKRIDRSEIFGHGDIQDMDDEEKEWSDAATSYYGKR